MSSLKSMLTKLMNEYASELSAARESNDFKRPLGNLVRQDISKYLQSNVDDSVYYVKGSVGAGRWTDVPWIAVFDKRITQSAQKGVYIVYLLNKDSKTLYLTLNQGATDVSQQGKNGKLSFTAIASADNSKTTFALETRAKQIRAKLSNSENVLIGTINSGSTAYDAGCIYYKEYHLDTIPEDDILISDLKQFVELYQKYYKTFVCENTNNVAENLQGGENEVPVSTKEAILQIRDYIEARGFTYKDKLIENFFLSLKSKPFVILAGTSGTGKTRLVKLFAEAIGAEYKLIPVRPDWSDGSDLFGHYDLNSKFIEGPICECFKLANEKPNKPVLLCLDEMNLARVEYYLSDFLSVIESREKNADGKVTTIPIAQYENGIPDNLYLIGTVNMDETTFPFSKKVLDRANTIEFSYVDLTPDFNVPDVVPETLQLPNSFLRTDYLILSRDCISEQEYVSEICAELQTINEILVMGNAHMGYRVRDEIAFYMLNNKAEGELLTHDEAFDNEIMQKILPRIQGSSATVKTMLCELFKLCAADQEQKIGDTDSEKMRKVLADTSINCRYRKSAKKLELMVRRFEEDGFTSYWL